jgi:hypothetical protein
MPDWTFFNAFQVGALVAIALCFGIDGLHRKDYTMGWLSFTCVLTAFRHVMGLLGASHFLAPDTAYRLQSFINTLSYLALAKCVTLALPGRFPRRYLLGLGLGLFPNLIRTAFLPLDHPLAKIFLYSALASYAVGNILAIVVVTRARAAGDPMGKRLFIGLMLTAIPVFGEILAVSLLHVLLPFSGLAVMVVAVTIGVSWLWFISQDLEAKVDRQVAEAALWRGMIPGLTWRSEENSPAMKQLLGPEWRQRLDDRVIGKDGVEYLVHKASLEGGEEIGWLQGYTPTETRPGIFFLLGWRVALGMDEGKELERVRTTLEAWGANVEWWGTVPPREGPYPSLLIWAREPSILTVWREGDLARRKARWIQVGGAEIEGPHVRLDSPLSIEALRNALQKLLSFGA